jgi:hypothetical protein
MLTRLLASAACTAMLFSSVAVACPNAGPSSASGSASTGATAAAKKKCKKGYHLVHKHCKKRSHLQQQR